jgi:hypothetical protein
VETYLNEAEPEDHPSVGTARSGSNRDRARRPVSRRAKPQRRSVRRRR